MTDQTAQKSPLASPVLPIPQPLLLSVEKPARYIGKEIHMAVKDSLSVGVRFAFCFPDVYEVGMSHLGLQILYAFLNRRPDTYCERVFAPWLDMERVLRAEQIPLFSLETYSPVRRFDFVGFTLQYEMSYTNIVNMLDLSAIPLYAAERGEADPIVCAGGPCAYNPEPLAEIVDFFYLGEGEASLDALLDCYLKNKAAGGTKTDFLTAILSIPGVYVPRFYDVTYHADGSVAGVTRKNEKAPAVVRKVIADPLGASFYPEKQLVPLTETVHDRVTLEVFRGCSRGCRFCQAGYVYRPVREKDPETLIGQAKALVAASGHEEISLVSLSTGDYSAFRPLADGLVDEFSGQNVNLSLPSLRIDAFNLTLMEKVQAVRRSSLTFAPEAGTQRLRDVINKNLTEEEILSGCKLAFEGGWQRVKLYFMTGLPTETADDLAGIGLLGDKIVAQYFQLPKDRQKRGVSVTLSTSCFVPKPFTPFQWARQDSYETFREKHIIVKKSIRRKQINYQHHDAKLAVIEGVLARGDRKIARVIVRAWQLGARFDGWTEQFRYDIWAQAFADCGLDPAFYTRQRDYDETLPWDHLSVGVSKQFLRREAEKALAENPVTTPDCRKVCAGCGAGCFDKGKVCADCGVACFEEGGGD